MDVVLSCAKTVSSFLSSGIFSNIGLTDWGYCFQVQVLHRDHHYSSHVISEQCCFLPAKGQDCSR